MKIVRPNWSPKYNNQEIKKWEIQMIQTDTQHHTLLLGLPTREENMKYLPAGRSPKASIAPSSPFPSPEEMEMKVRIMVKVRKSSDSQRDD